MLTNQIDITLRCRTQMVAEEEMKKKVLSRLFCISARISGVSATNAILE